MRLVESILLLAAYMAASQAHPSAKRHQHKNTNIEELNSNSTDLHKTPVQYKSIYVQFASKMPAAPPWTPPSDSLELNRTRRSTNRTTHHIRTSVCDSISRWVAKTTADDMWGNTVNVVQKIDVNGARMNQYFFETHCVREHCQCRGIDTTQYNSKCESKHIFAYAKVVDSVGTEGWNLIKLRGSCSCSITAKVDEIYQSIWDDLR